MKRIVVGSCLLCLVVTVGSTAQEQGPLAGHPRPSYEDVEDIGAMASALRTSLASRQRYSFSRGWWQWDRLRCRFVDEGRKDRNAAIILQAVFRGLILDWHQKLEARGEGDLFYIFFTTNPGNKGRRTIPDGRTVIRDLHGGGYHGGWGGAARMRIYEELVRQDLLTAAEQQRFQRIVYQSLEPRFLDFSKGSQQADNHAYGNGGGVALALKLFPKAPHAPAARTWIDRIWLHLSDFGDWTEWTYYPYGPIFLHGLLDIAEATGRMESDRELINAVARRCLFFNHGGGVKGTPNSGARVRKDTAPVYADPWNVGYYHVETSGRDGHFWYRLAQHYRDPEYLWAAEQVALGGRPPGGDVPDAYRAAYTRRFRWFVDRNIRPRLPDSRTHVGFLSERKHRIPERLILNTGLAPEKPFAAYFLFDKKDGHLDNVSGHLYEYSVNGAKLLHSSGKYNNVYSGDALKGGGTGEESLDLLLVTHARHSFPVHPDRQGDHRDFMRRGSIKQARDLLAAENNQTGDSFGQFGFNDYYGPASRWVRRSVLTAEGYLVVADHFVAGKSLKGDYLAGPVWHLADEGRKLLRTRTRNWFDAPAVDRAWWQKKQIRVLAYLHDDGQLTFGAVRQTHSQDLDANVTTYAFRPIRGGRTERFLTVFVPHESTERPHRIAAGIKTAISKPGTYTAAIGNTMVTIHSNGDWLVTRR